MSQEHLKIGNNFDVTEAISRCNEKILIFSKKLDMHEKRKAFSRESMSFELYRRRFYTSLNENIETSHNIKHDEVKEFWSTILIKRENDTVTDVEHYLPVHIQNMEVPQIFQSYNEFQEIIKNLPNWKAAGPDGVFNFFIKKLDALHSFLYDVVRKICLENHKEEEWFYKGITY